MLNLYINVQPVAEPKGVRKVIEQDKNKPNWFIRHKKLLLWIAGILLVLGILGSFSDTSKQQTNNSAPTTPVVAPAATQEAAPTPQTINDKLWSAYDSINDDRKGIDISYQDGKAELTVKEKTYWDDKAILQSGYSLFTSWGDKIKSNPEVKTISVKIYNELTDQYGKSEVEEVVGITMLTENFNKFEWKNLEYQPIHNQIRENGELFVAFAIARNINFDEAKLSYTN